MNVTPISINVLLFIMTVFSLLSSHIYAKNMSTGNKLQLILIPLIFLVLLYDAPASLLIYLTCNNIFSFIKYFGFMRNIRTAKNLGKKY